MAWELPFFRATLFSVADIRDAEMLKRQRRFISDYTDFRIGFSAYAIAI